MSCRNVEPAGEQQGTEAGEQPEAVAGDAQPRTAENRGGGEPRTVGDEEDWEIEDMMMRWY